MKKKAITAFMLASILSVSAMTTTVFAAPAAKSSTETTQGDQKQEKRTKHCEEAAEPENAIGRDAAKEKALSDAGVTEDQAGRVMAHVSTLDDGTVIYKVRFICNETGYSYQINAVSGAIVDKSSEAVTEDMKKEGHGRGMWKGDKTADQSAKS